MDIKKSLEVLKDLRDTAAIYQEFEVKELDAVALDFAISYIENTAQEGKFMSSNMKNFIKFIIVHILVYLLVELFIYLLMIFLY